MRCENGGHADWFPHYHGRSLNLPPPELEKTVWTSKQRITQALRNMLSSSCANFAADRRAPRHHIHERPSPSARAHTRRWEGSALLSELPRRPARTARQLSLQSERTDARPGETRTARRRTLRGMEGDTWRSLSRNSKKRASTWTRSAPAPPMQPRPATTANPEV